MYEAELFKNLYVDLYAENGKYFDSKYMKYYMNVPESLDAEKNVSFYGLTDFKYK